MFYVKELENVTNELDTLLSEVDTNRVGREIAIIKRSIENLDRTLGLFDLSDEENLKNANDLAKTVGDYINYRYNGVQAQSPMIDYELTLIQAWFRNLIDILEANGDINKMSEQFKKNKAETIRMTAEARAAHKEAVLKAKEEYKKQMEEMEAKQNELDAADEAEELVENAAQDEQLQDSVSQDEAQDLAQDEQLQDSVDNAGSEPEEAVHNLKDYETQ